MPFVFVSRNHPKLSMICRNGLDLDLTCFETVLLIFYFTSEIQIKKGLETKGLRCQVSLRDDYLKSKLIFWFISEEFGEMFNITLI